MLEEQRVLAALELRLLVVVEVVVLVLRRLVVVVVLLVVMVVVVVLHRVRLLQRAALLELRARRHPLEEHADGAVLADPVAHLGRVDPHGELGGEEAVQLGGHEADVDARLRDHGVHLAVDAQAAVAAAAVRLVGEPVVPVAAPQHLRQRALEHLELALGQLAGLQAQQLHEEVGRGDDF